MKKLHKVLAITLVMLTATSTNLMAQDAPPPPPAHDQTGNQPGGNAPIGALPPGTFPVSLCAGGGGGAACASRFVDVAVKITNVIASTLCNFFIF